MLIHAYRSLPRIIQTKKTEGWQLPMLHNYLMTRGGTMIPPTMATAARKNTGESLAPQIDRKAQDLDESYRSTC